MPIPHVPDIAGQRSQPETRSDEAKARSAVRAGVFAYFVDMYDIYLPVLTLLPAAAYFSSADISPRVAAILSSLVFVSTFVARPIGAAVFGHFADRRGRKKMTLVAVGGFGVCTLLIACLPGYETIGIWSISLLIALRFLDGIFLGGEYTTAVPLAMEWSPKNKRGINGGIITSMSPASYSVLAVFTLVLLQGVPSGSLDSPYVQWGWRIPFAVGAVLAIGLFVLYSRSVEEPETERAASGKSPLLMLLTSEHRGALLQVFVLMTGIWFITYVTTAVFPGLLVSHLGYSSGRATAVLAIATAVAAIAYVGYGQLSQIIGRRTFYIAYGFLAVTAGSALFAAIMTAPMDFWMVVVAASGFALVTICSQAVIASYLTERFPSQIRASGYGVGYSLALIIPSFYAFYIEGLSEFIPNYLAPVVLIVIGGLLVAGAAAAGPETRDVDMQKHACDRSSDPELIAR
ncbi:MFS transporter [Rhodococcus wratislaviensis]|uniref:Putative major facilitator superfamily transporter n=1 Tax=Rhodococcus wratislaviensis NBRC 100605 TaxID=1219028 RepID=X0RBC5_RHOWR|nr:MFS transporter [Rhodococcus wratislaviensis]GAF48325.1 putative major facilitator superfamily transporter [Rhodococcus wratislaviensis NBRC 100605]